MASTNEMKMDTDFKLFDAEYKLMSVVWEHEPINSTELCKICMERHKWKKSTIYNMIRKLSERDILQNDNATVTALVKKEFVQKYESEALLEKSFNNSLPAFLAAFLDGRKISAKEADELKKLIEEAEK